MSIYKRINQLSIIILLLISINTSLAQECISKGLLVPIMNYIKCEQLSGYFYRNYTGTGSDGVIIKCGDTEVTERCELSVKVTDMAWVGGESVCYREIYSDGKEGPEVCPLTDLPYDRFNQNLQFIRLRTGVSVRIYHKGINWLFQTVYGDIQVTKEYVAYGLRNYPDVTTISTTTCDISKTGVNTNDLCSATSDKCEYVASTNLGLNEAVSYVKNWVLGIPDLNLQTYNNKKYYCRTGGLLYNVGTIQLQSGCYEYPSDFSGIDLDCCPGEKTINAYCGSDFKWHNIVQLECTTNTDCKSGYSCINNRCVTNNMQCISSLDCYGAGTNTCQLIGTSYYTLKYSCINGFCQEGVKTRVNCCPPNYGCSNGQVCDINTYTCMNQIGPEIKCGDNVCSSPYENEFSCSNDCKIIIKPADQTIIISIIIGLLITILLSKYLGGGTYGISIGVISGILSAYLIWWLLTNWIWVMIGGVAISGVILWIVIGGGGLVIIRELIWSSLKKKVGK